MTEQTTVVLKLLEPTARNNQLETGSHAYDIPTPTHLKSTKQEK